MKRIRELASSPDPVMARAAALLAGAPPLDTSRIRRRPPPLDARPRPRTMRLRVALVLAFTFASAVAGATTWRHRDGWLRLFASSRTSASDPSPVLAPVAPVRGVPPPLTPRESTATSPVVASTSSATRATTASAPRSAPKETREARTLAAVEDESALMVEAVRALRRDHDPQRAGALAQEVLQKYPHGALVEEAMAVIMEAASADGDAAGARRWAQRYLDMFASGRFADRARQVLAPPR